VVEYSLAMANITATCNKCNKQFLIIDQEQRFLQNKNLPLPLQCPQCRQMRRLLLRGGRQLFRTTCQQCGKNIVVSYDPAKVINPILCKEDYTKWANENDALINEPLPE
jgi:ssDNA-binding Zn-finger/Zn-ribbon topoisomerase 1